MNRKQRQAIQIRQVAFWDTSAVVPLCCWQPQTQAARQAHRSFSNMVVWWATGVESLSAFYRLQRGRYLMADELETAKRMLVKYRQVWTEVVPLPEVRNTAEALLAQHDLRGADALQLAAALAWCSFHPQGRTLVANDGKLLAAAAREGFTTVQL